MATHNIEFVKVGEAYVAAFQIGADFALHIERSEAGPLTMGLSSIPDSQFALVENFPERARHQTVTDYTFVGEVYDKYIKIVSSTEPTLAVVTSSGELTPIEIPVEPEDGGVIEYHFEIPMENYIDNESGFVTGDYSEVYNKLSAFAEKNAGYAVDGIIEGDILANNVNITFNGDKVIRLRAMLEYSEIQIATEAAGPMGGGWSGNASGIITPTSLGYEKAL